MPFGIVDAAVAGEGRGLVRCLVEELVTVVGEGLRVILLSGTAAMYRRSRRVPEGSGCASRPWRRRLPDQPCDAGSCGGVANQDGCNNHATYRAQGLISELRLVIEFLEH